MTTTTVAKVESLEGVERVEGPFQGYHNVTYAVRLDPGSPLGLGARRMKLREPRPGVFWFDLRVFRSEDQLLPVLQGRIPRIPLVTKIDGHASAISFIEGRTLGSLRGQGGSTMVGPGFLDQIEELFRHLAAFDVAELPATPQRPCRCALLRGDGSSTAFLRGVVHFTRKHVYAPHRKRFAQLLADLDVPEGVLGRFGRELPQLTRRPYRLLHGDLHRQNFIVDADGGLWTIDWELALVGDPLYDLATHLHLMRYPLPQEREVTLRWKRAVGEAAARGADEDLPHYRAYKRIQSVFTDVIRGATGLDAALDHAQLRQVAATVWRTLRAAQEPLGLEKVVSRVVVEAAFEAWHRRHAAPVTGGRGPSTWPGR
ncbi:aminoglycoside phosphotransferase family protein [Streptomyces sp. NPDC006733]|uniref:aminoglycoside phosphotransferase family protein n=1 Tax=Streptomyces sp. NPDC006733 TaxID=3155460 RepID=UPI00340D89CC